ncbi:MAG: hypothetical protein EOP14_03645 [Pseudomonas sp.]|nr:MAG: hypothetical protein EOP14_03645 [Pseudomonas sp.]
MTIETDDLDDEQLAATAYVWRHRAEAGEKNAYGTWARLELELQHRLGPTPSNHSPLGAQQPKQRLWWQFW